MKPRECQSALAALVATCVLGFLFPLSVQAGCEPRLEWTRSHNGAANSYDYAMFAALDSSGSILVWGLDRDNTPPSCTGLLIKYSQSGEVIWTVSWTGVRPTEAATDDDNNVYLAGYETTDPPRWLIAKHDPTGRLLWTRTPESAEIGRGMPFSIAVDRTGHVIAAGFQRRPAPPHDAACLILRYDRDGRLIWTRTYDNPAGGDDVIRTVTTDSSGNIIAAGFFIGPSPAKGPIWLVRKYSATGDLLWSRTNSGPVNSPSVPNDVAVDARDNITVVGSFGGTDADDRERPVIRKYDPGGRLLWQRTYEAPDASIASFNAVAVDRDGGLLTAGLAWSSGQNRSYEWLIRKYDTSGKRLWSKTHSSSAELGDSAFSIAAGAGGIIVVTGYEDRSDLGQATNWLVMKLRQVSPCK